MSAEDSVVNPLVRNKLPRARVEDSLSTERFGTYLQATEQDGDAALKLYTWNTAVSAAFYGPLQALEIALRNSMHRELSKVYGESWYLEPGAGLDAGCNDRIHEVIRDLKRSRYATDPPHVVAAMSFGFWVSLLGSGGFLKREPGSQKANYEMTLWRTALWRAFPYGKGLSRKEIHKPLDFLRTLRNRIAHHEPIFSRHLQQDYTSILEITGWIAPPKRLWIERHSRVDDVLQTPPTSEDIKF